MSFIILDGPNGSGKTTIINNLKEKGYSTLSSPNGTSLAKMLRPACRGTEPWEDIDPSIQFMLFSAARYDEYIRCVHNKSEIVLADRWWTSTYSYQCILQNMSVDFMEHTIHPEEKIDHVFILSGDSNVLAERVEKERLKNPNHKKCSWTKNIETMEKIGKIYTTELPNYLETKNISHSIIDTTNQSINSIQNYIESNILCFKTP